MKLRTAACLLSLWLVLQLPATAEELKDSIDKSDLIIVGKVVSVTEGTLDPQLQSMGINFRTDTAVIGVAEALKGLAPKIAKVNVRFPGFPKPGEPTLKVGQDGIFFLVITNETTYSLEKENPVMAMDKLADVRRGVREWAGIVEKAPQPKDEAKLLAELKNGKQPQDRRDAVLQLGEMQLLRHVPALIDALNDDAATVRTVAHAQLVRITGFRSPIDFETAGKDDRAKAVAEWKLWWDEHKDKKREQVLLDAADHAARPQPDATAALHGLAELNNPAHERMFQQALQQAIDANNNYLVIVVVQYLGRIKSQSSIGAIGRLLEQTPLESIRFTCVNALGKITGQDFGPEGPASVKKAIEWWQANKAKFSAENN